MHHGNTLEQELAQAIAAARLAGRQARAVSRRVGFDGHGPTTLAAAGGAEGYTRERVRQLESRLQHHLAAGVELPLTQAALRVVESAVPAPRADIAQRLMTEGIAARPFDPVA